MQQSPPSIACSLSQAIQLETACSQWRFNKAQEFKMFNECFTALHCICSLEIRNTSSGLFTDVFFFSMTIASQVWKESCARSGQRQGCWHLQEGSQGKHIFILLTYLDMLTSYRTLSSSAALATSVLAPTSSLNETFPAW